MFYVAFLAFHDDFYPCVSTVFYVAFEIVLSGYSIDKGTESDALDDADSFDFCTHLFWLPLLNAAFVIPKYFTVLVV